MTRIRQTATQLDTAIDELLRDPSGAMDPAAGELTATARLLRDALPRLHPRFSFEEHLAARLAAAGGSTEWPAAVHGPLPIRPHVVVGPPSEATLTDGVRTPSEHRRLGLVAGGAIASGVSLAGAALVVWRRSRSGGIF